MNEEAVPARARGLAARWLRGRGRAADTPAAPAADDQKGDRRVLDDDSAVLRSAVDLLSIAIFAFAIWEAAQALLSYLAH
ncbi:MAG TPA: hypothetical protein VN980_13880 [Alphaproteobacteria bacterium]|nr:hypothetical protein [Alphaproteobacteria bacterium]